MARKKVEWIEDDYASSWAGHGVDWADLDQPTKELLMSHGPGPLPLPGPVKRVKGHALRWGTDKYPACWCACGAYMGGLETDAHHTAADVRDRHELHLVNVTNRR